MFDSKERPQLNFDNKVFTNKLGDFVIIIMLVLATLVNFTEFKISIVSYNKITAISILVYIMATMTYNHCFNKGKIAGRKEQQYKDVMDEYNKEIAYINGSNLLAKFSKFVEQYRKTDLVDFRKGVLVQYEIPYEEYEKKFLRMSTMEILKQRMSLRLKLAIIKCNSVKPFTINKSSIISGGENNAKRRNPLGVSGHTMEKVSKFSSGAIRLTTTIFTATICVDIVFNFSWETIVQWAIRMLPILTALVLGRWAGYKNVSEIEISYKKNQIYIIQLFKEWCKNYVEPQPIKGSSQKVL